MAMDDMNKPGGIGGGTGEPAGAGGSRSLPDVLPEVKASVGEVAGQVTQDLRTAAETAKADASRLLDEARNRVTGVADDYKEGAAEQIHRVADTVREVARGFSERDQSSIAGLADDVADGIERFSDSIRNKQVGDLLTDVQSFARTQPVMFAAAAFAAGFLVTRFLRSSSEAVRESQRRATVAGNPRTAQLGMPGGARQGGGMGAGASSLPGAFTGGRDNGGVGVGTGSTASAGGSIHGSGSVGAASPGPGVPKPTQAL